MPSKQFFKAIYFPDYKAGNPKAKGFVLAFGDRNRDLYKAIARKTSHELTRLSLFA
jgi:hypothetical protein